MALETEKARSIVQPAVGEIAGLTSIRGLAAWWVVFFHIWGDANANQRHGLFAPVAHGYLAVDLFFILSGYVIALNYADRLAVLSVRRWAAFLWIRIARIYPLHFCMLLVFVAHPLAAWLLVPRGFGEGGYDIGYFLLSFGLVQGWGFDESVRWNYPAWSISTEWLAYILFPLMLWLTRRMRSSRSACFAMAGCSLFLLALAARSFGGSLGADLPHLGPIRCVLEFWAGACLSMAMRRPAQTGNGPPLMALGAASFCFFIYAVLPVADYVSMPLGFLFLVWALSFPAGILARLMGGRAIMFLGTISYSTYMVHAFAIDIVRTALRWPDAWPAWAYVVCLILTFVMSVLLYRFVELPGRRMLRRIDAGGPKGAPAAQVPSVASRSS